MNILVVGINTTWWFLHTESNDSCWKSGTLYISSYLKKRGFSVECLNLFFYKNQSLQETISEAIKKYKPDIVMTGGMIKDFSTINDIVGCVKRFNSDIVTVIGGGFVTFSAHEAMTIVSEADYGVIGEGEYICENLVNCLLNDEDISKVNGIIFRKDGELYKTNPQSDIINIDELPFPDYEGFRCFELINKCRIIQVLGARSCPFSCTYCLHSGKYRQRSLDNIFAEIDYLSNNCDFNYLTIIDELFCVDENRLQEFIYRIKPYNLKWVLPIRASNRISLQTLVSAKEAGCIQMQMGIESGDSLILKSMKKGITLSDVREKLSLFKEARLTTSGGVILGDKEETIESIENSIDFVKETIVDDFKYHSGFNMISLYPGSQMYDYAVDIGKIKNMSEHITNGTPHINVTKMSDEEYNFVSNMILPIENLLLEYNYRRKNSHLGVQLDSVAEEKVIALNYNDKSYEIAMHCPNCNTVFSYFKTFQTMHYDIKRLHYNHCVNCWQLALQKVIIRSYLMLDEVFWKLTESVFDYLFQSGDIALFGIGDFFTIYRKMFLLIEKNIGSKYGGKFILTDNDRTKKIGKLAYDNHIIYAPEEVLTKVKNVVIPNNKFEVIQRDIEKYGVNSYSFFELPFVITTDRFSNQPEYIKTTDMLKEAPVLKRGC